MTFQVGIDLTQSAAIIVLAIAQIIHLVRHHWRR